ncbi:CRE-MEX-5 protein [Caenorhabditis remanei]|uniref:CRE-MEX-5 protein n=2 Tax=Caenorhabditis remanei TaxID=31234 RepID=E3MGB7_CAERE|nr:CRE-MEX-5 protein [Caenorhabditis remanei]
MKAASSSVSSSGGAMSPTKTQLPPAPPSHHPQQQQAIYDPQMQYYYTAAMPGQQMPTYVQQNGSSQAYAPSNQYFQDASGQYVQVAQQSSMSAPQPIMVPGQSYIYMAPPQQGPQQVVQPGQPQLIYYQQAIGQMPPQTAPVYFHPMQPTSAQMISDQMTVMPQMQPTLQQQTHQHRPMGMEMSNPRAAPLTSSTPLPTSAEYETMQRDTHARNRNIQLRYHRVMEHDELPIDEISDIGHDDTMSAEKENHMLAQHGEKTARRGFKNAEEQPPNYKTRLCMMHASGTRPCDMGSRCKFAHGLKELRSTDAPARYPNNKYKTKLCKNFARGGSGFCPYGLRCEFVHPTDKEFQNIPPYQRLLVDDQVLDQDVVPEDYVVARHQPRFLRSSGRSTTPTKVMLKHRNVAGSMMCLSNAGREAAAAGGDFSQADASPEYLPPHLRRGRMANPPTTKRRTSLSTKWTSEENLGLHGHY